MPSVVASLLLSPKLTAHSLSWSRSMGGGPRTFPGGVNKWQWKRMQQKKYYDIQKKRLSREKQIFEMRQRAEVLAAHPELEEPWEKLATFPSDGVTAEEQIRRLTSRFDKPGGEDLWTQKDGPVGVPPSDSENATEFAKKVARSADDRREDARSPFAARSKKHAVGKKGAKGRKEDPIAKNVQDYFDSFESDPLGISDANRPGSK